MGKRPFKDDRKLMAIAEEGATVDSAARSLGTSVQSIREKAGRLGISIRDGRLSKRHSVRVVEIGLKVTVK